MVSYLIRFKCGYTMTFASGQVLENRTINYGQPCTWCGGVDSDNFAVRDRIERSVNRTDATEAGAGNENVKGKGSARKEDVSFKEYLAKLKK